jgi:hypothetical protein
MKCTTSCIPEIGGSRVGIRKMENGNLKGRTVDLKFVIANLIFNFLF